MPAKKAKKVLIVEDDLLLAKALTSKFDQEGYETALAKDGQSALDKTAEDTPDIILLDLMLPVMSGFQVLSNLKLNKDTRDIPVLILSNLGQAEEIKRCEDLGANDYLVKSDVSLKSISDKVEELLKGKKK